MGFSWSVFASTLSETKQRSTSIKHIHTQVRGVLIN
jgi:hypothetical protein